jgi:hypothetical protein
MTTIRKTAAIAAFLLAAGVAQAAPPRTITYSGFLLDTNGAPVGGSPALTFRLYDAACDTAPCTGNLLYSEVVPVVTNAADGYFTATIGLTTLIADTVFSGPVYLTVKYGTEAEMLPRVAISSVPSAFSSLTVDWNGVKNRPTSSCSSPTPYVTGIDVNGAVTCAAAPAGAAAGCAAGNILKWSGSAWSCQADDNTTYTVNAPLTMAGTAISIAAANATTNGYLSFADWNTFNGKLSTVSANTPITGNGTSGSPLTIAPANGTTPGYLTASDWNTFNGKLGTVTVTTPITGNGTAGAPLAIAPANGSTPGYLTSGDWNVFSNKVAVVGVASNGGLVVSGSTNPALSLTTSCAGNEVLRWNAALSSWGCSATTTGTVTNVTATLPLSVGTGTTTPLISMTQANATTNGWLLSTDWNTFNTKLTTAAVAAPLTGNGTAGSPISLAVATALQPGYVTTTDWTAFAAKQNRIFGNCPAGTFMQSIDAAGNPTCGTDANTTYTAGAGLQLTGTTFSIPASAVTPAMHSPGAAGQVLMTNATAAWQTISGDATLSSTGALTLANSGITAGGYRYVVVDAKGRVTSGANPTTLGASGITDGVQLQSATPGTGQTGHINVSGTVIAGTFSGNLNGTATGVVANAITPSDINQTNSPGTGQVPMKAPSDSFTWVTPITTVTAGSGISITGSAPNPTVSVSQAMGTGSLYLNSGTTPVLIGGGNFLTASSAVSFTTSRVCTIHWSAELDASVTTSDRAYAQGHYRRSSTNYTAGFYNYFGNFTGGEWKNQSGSFVMTVNANDPTQFGCYVNTGNATLNYNYANCYITYLCI